MPNPLFRAELERRLFAPERSRTPFRRGSWQLRLAGATAVAGLAATFAAFGLVGTGPLSTGGNEDVRAKDGCRFVPTLGPTRAPYIVELADGSLEVRFRRESAERLVKRCR